MPVFIPEGAAAKAGLLQEVDGRPEKLRQGRTGAAVAMRQHVGTRGVGPLQLFAPSPFGQHHRRAVLHGEPAAQGFMAGGHRGYALLQHLHVWRPPQRQKKGTGVRYEGGEIFRAPELIDPDGERTGGVRQILEFQNFPRPIFDIGAGIAQNVFQRLSLLPVSLPFSGRRCQQPRVATHGRSAGRLG